MAAGAIPSTAGPPGSYQQEDAAGHSWHSWGQLGTAGGIPVRAGVTPAASLRVRLFGAAGEQARSGTQGTCFSDGNSAAGRVVKLLGSC